MKLRVRKNLVKVQNEPEDEGDEVAVPSKIISPKPKTSAKSSKASLSKKKASRVVKDEKKESPIKQIKVEEKQIEQPFEIPAKCEPSIKIEAPKCSSLSSDEENDFEDVLMDDVKILNNNLPKSKQADKKPVQIPIEKPLDVNLSENIDMMLQMEKLNKGKQVSAVVAPDMAMEEDDDDEFEEVDMASNENELNMSALKKRGDLEVNITDKKSKKPIDLAAKMARMLKSLDKKLTISAIKTHLVCWLAHGFYLNKTCVTELMRCIAFSSIDMFKMDKFQLVHFDKTILKSLLKQIKKEFVLPDEKEFLDKNLLITEENLSESFRSLKCSNYLQYMLVVLLILRALHVKVRLCVCFDVIELVSSESKKPPIKRKSKQKETSDDDEEENLPKPALKRMKSETVISKRLSNLDSDMSCSESKTKKKPLLKSKSSVKNNKVLSSDSADNESPKSGTTPQATNSRNYWLEVYLEEERMWTCVEPFELKIDCASYLEKRFGKQVLYVVGFDNDNKVKDVTKRYASKWTTTTRLLRISHFEEKKLWWEKMMQFYEPIDANLDIEEEKQLKEMLLAQGLPDNVSDYKNHPLYVLRRHLLKFEAIYPENAKPIGQFRSEPVYSRDNQVMLHSRQTWLKYARTVKPFEKPSKIVKGRMKRSEFKAGCRENPDLDLYGFWQTKIYEPPLAENGRVPLNEFGNVELFQPCMLPRGCVHLKNMPNLKQVCRRLKVECAAAVVGFDAHGGWSHAVYDGWVICEQFKEAVVLAYEEEEIQNNKKMIEKHQEKIWSNWKRLIKVMLIRERLKLKYNDNEVVHSTKDSDKHMSTDDERETTKAKSNPPKIIPSILIAENKAAKSKSIIKKVAKVVKKNKKDEQSDSETDEEYVKKSRKNPRKKPAKPKSNNSVKEIVKVQNETSNDSNPIVETPHNDDLMLSENEDEN